MKPKELFETQQCPTAFLSNARRHWLLMSMAMSAVVTLMMPQRAMAQERQIKGLQSFVATVDGTPVQGEKFTVVYTMTASHWGAGGMPKQGNGIRLLDVKYETKRPAASENNDSTPALPQMVATATYITSRSGEVTLPGMTVPIDDTIAVSEPKAIEIQKNPQYGEEMSRAHEYLIHHGQNPDSICLNLADQTEYYWLFQDEYNMCSCAITPKDIWEALDDPVLFYSTESVMNTSGQHFRRLLQPYADQVNYIRQLKAEAEAKAKRSRNKKVEIVMPAPTELPYKPQSSHVWPMFGNMRWGQGDPYNIYSPTVEGKKALVGCVPLAMGMVMNYYRWPAQGRGMAYYKTDTRLYKIDFAQSKPQWASYKKQYKSNERDAVLPSLSRLLVDLGRSTAASFSGEATSASLSSIKVPMCNNLAYSSRMTYVQKGLSEAEIAATIYRELDGKRPCMVSYDGHAFICDGYEGEYLHYVLGWHGASNGYYRLKLTPLSDNAADENKILIKSLVYGIEPAKPQLRLPKRITMEEAGTLSEQLSNEEKSKVTDLTITGPINSKDIMLLRKMGGANNKHPFDGEWLGGALTILHLDNATIVSDDTPYLTEKATGHWTFNETVDGQTRTVNYDFENMDEATWKAFMKDIGDRQPGMFYTRSDDNTYLTHYTTQDSIVGRRMFEDCASLSVVTLPKNTKKVGNYAFYGCTLLKRMRLPASVEEVGDKPFFQCPSLERIEAPEKFSNHATILEGCSPALNQLITY